MLGTVKRVEDPRLLRGQGRYVGDLRLPGQVEIAFLRSPHAHARLRGVDTRVAQGQPGVVAVLTGAEAVRSEQDGGGAGMGAGARALPLRPLLGVPSFKVCELPCLATDKVRFVGQAVAAVVATDRY